MNSAFSISLKVLLFTGTVLSLFANTPDVILNARYACIVEKVLLYKEGGLKIFYGGPVQCSGPVGVKWVMTASFEDENYQTRAVYEIAFVNCSLEDAKGAQTVFIEAPEIDIKFQNIASEGYSRFMSLIKGDHLLGKYIVIRAADVAMTFYPDIYVNAVYGSRDPKDVDQILEFLNRSYGTQRRCKEWIASPQKLIVNEEDDNQIRFLPVEVSVLIEGKPTPFVVMPYFLKQDPWKLYYVIAKTDLSKLKATDQKEVPVLRLDSGCVHGQIYHDGGCECLEQLHTGLREITSSPHPFNMLIHIPAHDGRGFGTAPKAETEIYKHGGRGRLHATAPLDTIAAAKLLYQSAEFDLREFDGAAFLLKKFSIDAVELLTDNMKKVKALERAHIRVFRKSCALIKPSCTVHLEAKKKHSNYFSK